MVSRQHHFKSKWVFSFEFRPHKNQSPPPVPGGAAPEMEGGWVGLRVTISGCDHPMDFFADRPSPRPPFPSAA